MVSVVSAGNTRPNVVGETDDRVSYLSRWLTVWIAVLVVTTLIVVGYLIAIGWSLQSVDDNVGNALQQVRSVQQDVSALPTQIDTVNSSLSSIAQSVEPLSGQIGETNSSLQHVDTDLGGTKASLALIAGSLGDTTNLLNVSTNRLQSVNGSLHTTAPALASIHQLAQHIDSVLENAESPADQLGAMDIYKNVARVNGDLRPASHDTNRIASLLLGVDGHLKSICRSPLLFALGVAPPC